MDVFVSSAELVLSTLNYPKTQRQLISETGLPSRTLRFALSKLKKSGIIEEMVSLKDARIKICRRRLKNINHIQANVNRDAGVAERLCVRLQSGGTEFD